MSDLGFQIDIASLVLSRARRALDIECDGVISSGLEARRLRENLLARLLMVKPGIRPGDDATQDDQSRILGIEQTFLDEADDVIVGRPIRNDFDPRKAALAIP